MVITKRANGRPKKVVAEVSDTTESKKNLSWTTKMENKLMELRLSKYIDQFTGTNERQQLTAAWNKLALELNLACKSNATVEQMKNK